LQTDNTAKRKAKPCETIDVGGIGYRKNVRAQAIGGKRRDVGRGIAIIYNDDAIAVGEAIVIPVGLSIENDQRWT
jgi:hypothetical protein